MNYGNLGTIIGHEMTHGFDNYGRRFDKTGNYVEWWKPESLEEYFKRSQCISDQYGNYTVEEIDEKVYMLIFILVILSHQLYLSV